MDVVACGRQILCEGGPIRLGSSGLRHEQRQAIGGFQRQANQREIDGGVSVGLERDGELNAVANGDGRIIEIAAAHIDRRDTLQG